MSEHHLAQLQEYSVPYSDNDRRHEVFIDTIGGVYEPKVDELCEEYEAYYRGIKLAEQQLLVLKSNKQFSRFVQVGLLFNATFPMSPFGNRLIKVFGLQSRIHRSAHTTILP